MGEVAANQEPAIVVSGLKPNHFYNVRVIAVGSNNFQAGSRVIRLRTFAQDGRPQLGNSRLPSNFMAEEPNGSGQGEHTDENGPARGLLPALETAASSEGVESPAREGSSTGGSGPRRNTITRRHSPSTTSLDQAPIRDETDANLKKSLPELTERLDSIRKESEEVQSLMKKEDADHRRTVEDLETEKQNIKGDQKKKEEHTEKLRRDVNSTDRAMRKAMQSKEKLEKSLKEMQNKREAIQTEIEAFDRQIEGMQKEQGSFEKKKQDLAEYREDRTTLERKCNEDLQSKCAQLEQELKEKREKVKELERERKQLPGGDDDGGWSEKETELRRESFRKCKELSDLHGQEVKNGRRMDEQIRLLSHQLQPITHPHYSPYTQANASATDFDNPTVTQLKRRSRNSNSFSNISLTSPSPPYTQVDPTVSVTAFSSSRTANPAPGFAPLPLYSAAESYDDVGIRAGSVPLSPSAATQFLPSFFRDEDDTSLVPVPALDSLLPLHSGSPENDPQSPASSGRPTSILSSPQGSTNNLLFPVYQADIDRRGLGSAANVTEATPHKLGGLFSFQRARPAKAVEIEGPLLGSLKQGQSQSFPRQADDPDGLGNKRRISLSGSWNMFNRNSAGPDVLEANAPNSRILSTKSFNPFSSAHRAPGLLTERDPSSPRPASIASSEFPRPSTDSNSMWGAVGDPPGLAKARGMWSSDMPWSRTPSRRPSLHGSPSALKTTLATAEDEILGENDTVPDAREVGVIGSRPPQSSKALGRLNPNAPAFIGSFFKPKSEKGDGRDKLKSKETKSKTKESKDKSRGKEPASTLDTTNAPSIDMESPSDPRKSRDGYSVHTQTSVSESRDSLSLDQSLSNTPSELASTGLPSNVKDEANVVRKLFRKSSSSKFSLPGRLGGKESGLFKKAPSSVASGTNSDRGFSVERSSIGDFEDIVDELSNGMGVGRSYDSVTSSPGLPPASSSKGKDSNKTPARWLSTFSKKGKREKESLELERAQASESEGLAEEALRN